MTVDSMGHLGEVCLLVHAPWRAPNAAFGRIVALRGGHVTQKCQIRDFGFFAAD